MSNEDNVVVTLPVIRIERQENGPIEVGSHMETVNLPAPIAEMGSLGFEDIGAAFNMRDWLQRACEAAGGKMVGGGFGMGQADIDVELEGFRFNVSIKPLT